MNPTFYIKKTDRLPPIIGTLKDGEGNVINLTGASAKFIMSTSPGGAPVIDAAASIIAPATGGRVQYNWAAPDTLTPGTYYGEFEITFPGPLLETFPNSGYITIIIQDDLT